MLATSSGVANLLMSELGRAFRKKSFSTCSRLFPDKRCPAKTLRFTRLNILNPLNEQTLLYEHAIPVGEEAVMLVHGVLVGPQNILAAGKRGDQHQQCRLRQMEVGQQGPDYPKLRAGIDKNVCFAGA